MSGGLAAYWNTVGSTVAVAGSAAHSAWAMQAAFRWAVACAGCLLAGLALRLVLDLAQRRWPALRSRPSMWLAAQAVSAAVALLALAPPGMLQFAPHLLPRLTPAAMLLPLRPAVPAAVPSAVPSAVLSAVPSATQSMKAPALALSPAQGSAPAEQAAGTARVAPGTPAAVNAPGTQALITMIASAWACIYLVGVALALHRRLRARRLWLALLAASRRLSPSELAAHGAFNPQQLAELVRHRLTVLETDASISPMLAGVRRPCLLLPRHLRGFAPEQQQMIVQHELQHRRQRDPLWLGASAALQTVFWFNPALRWLADRMAWALELRCDQHVLSGRPPQQRKQYAAALLMQWKAQWQSHDAPPALGAAFGGNAGGDSVADRIQLMRDDAAPRLGAAGAVLPATAMAALLAGGVLLQAALASNIPAPYRAAGLATAAAPAGPIDANAGAGAAAAPWRYPLDRMRVTSFFGVHREVLATPHKGIDLGAAKGTPVHAVAAGTVLSAGPLEENQCRYGIAVLVEHGQGGPRSLYAHLDSVAVQAGQHIAAGQTLGRVGETGFATGPHLHFEARQGDAVVDPRGLLAGLDQHATKRALKLRLEQQGY